VSNLYKTRAKTNRPIYKKQS